MTFNRFSKYNSRVIDAADLLLFAGYHTIKITVPVLKDELYWGKKVWINSTISKLLNGRYRYRRNYIWRHWVVDGFRLHYNRAGYLVLCFEPPGDFPHTATDLLPLSQWREVWPWAKEAVEELVDCPGLLSRPGVRLSRFDFGIDIFFKDPNLLISSMIELPVNIRYARKVSTKDFSNLRMTKKRFKAFSNYNREEKSGGEPILRLEFRNLERRAVDSALGLCKGIKAQPNHLADEELMTEYLKKSLMNYAIYPGVDIVPLDAAKAAAKNDTIRNHLAEFESWHSYGKEGHRYRVRRLRNVEKMVIGSSNNNDSLIIKNLYEAIWQAYEDSWS